MKKMHKLSIEQSKLGLDIAQVLKALEPVVYPQPQEIEEERTVFTSLVEQNFPAPVSLPLVKRIKQLTEKILPRFTNRQPTPRKERFVMSTALTRIFLIAGIIFSLATGTIVSAYTSLPDSPLYDAKLAMEQVSLNLMDDPAKLAIRHMALAHNRVKEMAQLSQQGEIPDGGTVHRLKQNLAYALHYAAQVQGDGMGPILAQAQTMAQNQIQALNQVQAQVGGNPDGPIGMALKFMHQFMFQLQLGVEDPVGFRYMHQNQANQASLDAAQAESGTDTEGHGQSGEMNGPGERYGNDDCDVCEPVGDAHKWGQDTVSTTSQECTDCTPAGGQDGQGNKNSHQYRQEGGTNGPGEPGGPNPDCDCPDCPNCDCPNPDCPNCNTDAEETGDGVQNGNANGPGVPNPDCEDCPNCDCPNPDCPNCNPDCPDCNTEPDETGDGEQNGNTNGPGGSNSDCPNCDCPDCPNCDPDCPNCDCECEGS